jgi:exopolysaccharide biosynthesis polyprenyl glycosylphosphotransferase
MLNRYLIIPFAILGDSLVLVASLFLALFVRAQAIPKAEFFATHATPFFLVLVTSICVFLVVGLYDIHSIVHRRTLFTKIVYAQGINAIFSFLFFYIITIWGITPKTILLLYVVFSSLLLSVWRAQIFPKLVHSIPKERALLIAEEDEGRQLYAALTANSPYPIEVNETFFIKTDADPMDVRTFFDVLPQKLSGERRPDVVIVDMRNKQIANLSQALYQYAGSGGRVRSFTEVYESVFDKVTESTLREDSIVTYLYGQNKGYDSVKRLIDIAIALPLFILSLPFYIFVWIGIKIQDGGKIFFTHDRMGRGGKRIKLYKFRSMTFGDTSATWVKTEGNQNRVTAFGAFIRKTRIDELPQLWNVICGDMSLVGPRPDIWALGVKSAEEIPFYKARLVVTPGLSGWAQTHMHLPPQNMEQTKERLLYDLYYVKNTSISLDILIALKTIKTLLSREGM